MKIPDEASRGLRYNQQWSGKTGQLQHCQTLRLSQGAPRLEWGRQEGVHHCSNTYCPGVKGSDGDGAHGCLLAHAGDHAVGGNGLLGHRSLCAIGKPDLTVHWWMGQDGLVAIRAPNKMLWIVLSAEGRLEEDVRLRMGSLNLGKWSSGEDVPTVSPTSREWGI